MNYSTTIFLNEIICILVKMPLIFTPKVQLKLSINHEDHFVPNRRPVIIQTNDDLFHLRKHPSLNLAHA